MSASLPLYRLQQIDSRLKVINTRLAEIRSALDSNPELNRAKAALDERNQILRKLNQELKAAEYELQAHLIKLQQSEASLYSGRIRNPKELQDLQKDVASMKRNNGTLEDKQLSLMMSIEDETARTEEAQKIHDHIQADYINNSAGLRGEMNTLEKETENLFGQRQAVLRGVLPAHLELYEALRLKKNNLAVSLVQDNSCNTCGSSLTPGMAQSARNSSQPIQCPMCGRILYST